jgi:hypothetical protein
LWNWSFRIDESHDRYRPVDKDILSTLPIDEIRTGIHPLDDLDAKIRSILDKSLFKSAHSIVEILRVARPTVLLYLHDSIGFRSFHLYRLVNKYMPQPHALRRRVCLSWQYICTMSSLRKAQ